MGLCVCVCVHVCVCVCMCTYLLLMCLCINAGNPGAYLTNNGSVYISQDGGLTWAQVCKHIRTYTYIHT